MRASRDHRGTAEQAIACDARDLVCARLFVLRGAACAALSEDPSGAVRRQRRDCALADFRRARDLLPGDAGAEDRLNVLVGLGNALTLARDNELDSAAAAVRNAELGAVAGSLAALPAGVPYQGYFASGAETFAALRSSAPLADVCAALARALQRLPADAPADLAPRVGLLRASIQSETRPPSRTCP
jgi:hypothetical protein